MWLSVQTGARERGAGALLELRTGCEGGTLLCRALPDGYYVVLLVSRGTPTGPGGVRAAVRRRRK